MLSHRYRTLGTERPGPVPSLPDRTLNHSCADNLALEEVTVLDTLVQAGRGGKWAVTEVRDILRRATPVGTADRTQLPFAVSACATK